MIRHFVAATLAALMFATPAIALAQSDNGTTSTYGDTTRKVAKSTHKSTTTVPHKTAAHKTAKSRKAKTKTASAK
jgi:hypothetical protein